MKKRIHALSFMALALCAALLPTVAFATTTSYHIEIQGTISTVSELYSKLGTSSWKARASSNNVAVSKISDFKNATISGTYTDGDLIILGYSRYVSNPNLRYCVVYNTSTKNATSYQFTALRSRLNNGSTYYYGVATQEYISIGTQNGDVYYGTGESATYTITSQDLDNVSFEWVGTKPSGVTSSATTTSLKLTAGQGTPAGTYQFKVTGKSGTTAVESSGTFIVKQATPAVNLVDESIIGSGDMRTVTLVATVNGVKADGADKPTGNVSFETADGITIASNVELNGGTASCQWETASGTQNTVIAKYNGDSNYTSQTAQLYVNTNRKTQNIELSDIGPITYGDTFTLSLSKNGSGSGGITYSSSNSSIVNIEGNAATAKNVGEVVIYAKKAADDEYNEATDDVTLIVQPKGITIKVKDASMTLGKGLPAFTYDTALANQSLVSGDAITGNPALSCSAYADAAGVYGIEASGGAITNSAGEDVTHCYDITYQSGTLTVSEAPSYPPVIEPEDGGSVAVDKASPEEGDTVTITPAPDDGKQVGEVAVTDAGGNSVPVADNGDGTYSFVQPGSKVTINVTFKDAGGGEADVKAYRSIYMPAIEGVTTNPAAGAHFVAGHGDFTFTAVFANGEVQKVFANGYYSGKSVELEATKLADGSYQYTLRQVTEPMTITFGSASNIGETGTEAVADEAKIWAHGGTLHISAASDTEAAVYSITGALVKTFSLSAGEATETLNRGVYIVKAGGKTAKVVIR